MLALRDRLRRLQRFIRDDALPGSRALWYSDTGAILERGERRCRRGSARADAEQHARPHALAGQRRRSGLHKGPPLAGLRLYRMTFALDPDPAGRERPLERVLLGNMRHLVADDRRHLADGQHVVRQSRLGQGPRHPVHRTRRLRLGEDYPTLGPDGASPGDSVSAQLDGEVRASSVTVIPG